MLNVSLSLVPYSSTQPAIDTTPSRTPRYKFWFYQAIGNMLKMGMESVSETLDNFHTLTQPSAYEHFIAVFNSASCTIRIVIGEQVLASILHIFGCRLNVGVYMNIQDGIGCTKTNILTADCVM